MKLLAIDTSTEACSASLHTGQETYTRFEVAPRKHAELILPMVRSLLDEAGLELKQLDALAFGQGPGAFTGVRIAAGVIQGLAYSVDRPVIPVSSLATLAQSVATEHEFIMPAFDARMDEIYYGFYEVNDAGLVRATGNESVIKPELISDTDNRKCYGIGSGWKTWHGILEQKFGHHLVGYLEEAYPSAEHMIPLAIEKYNRNETVSAEQALPVYLRNKVTG